MHEHSLVTAGTFMLAFYIGFHARVQNFFQGKGVDMARKGGGVSDGYLSSPVVGCRCRRHIYGYYIMLI